jgi:hypothetical protein
MANVQDSTHIGAPRSPIYLLFIVFGVALVIELFIGVPLVAYGLEMPLSILFPLVLITPNIYAAIVGSWAGTLLAADHTRTRLLSVVGITLATAVAIALIASLTASLSVVVRPSSPTRSAPGAAEHWLGHLEVSRTKGSYGTGGRAGACPSRRCVRYRPASYFRNDHHTGVIRRDLASHSFEHS